jgi:geranylgeranyl reductase family protein
MHELHDSEIRDVVVVGAGPGGSTAAYYLARNDLDVLLLDKSEFPRDKICGDGLTPRAVAVLHDMGVLNGLLAVGHRINGVEIHAPDGSITAAPIPSQNGLPASMLVVPRIDLDNAIRERAVASGARFAGRVHVSGIESTRDGVAVAGERDGIPVVIKARIAIIATGAAVSLLFRLGLLPKAPPMILAARGYFEGLSDGADRFQIRFDGVPLPGYGWIFPLSAGSANIGAGFFPHARSARRPSLTSRAVFESFIRGRSMGPLLARARPYGPVRSYPIRVDFPESPTSGGRILLVGEAAGLVNPLTGDGIDYAMESARLAAEHVIHMFDRRDLSRKSVTGYDRLLRAHFERLFIFSRRVRGLSRHPMILNRLVRLAARHEDLRRTLINVVLGRQPASIDLSTAAILKKLFILVR